MDDERALDPYRFSEARPHPEDAAETTARPTSTWVTLIAVFLMLMGLWGALGSAAGIATVMLPEAIEGLFGDPSNDAPYLDEISARSDAAYESADRTLAPMLLVVHGVNLALSVVFVVAAGGLLSRREWARKLTLATVAATAAITIPEIAIVGWSTYVYGSIAVAEIAEVSTLYASGDEILYSIYFGVALGIVVTIALYVAEYVVYWFAWRTLRREDVRLGFR